jgi:Ca2+-binding EF-hand superfamily protein
MPVDEGKAMAAFSEWDKDGSGFISTQELVDVMKAIALSIGQDEDWAKAGAKNILDTCDVSGDGKLSKEEFRKGMGLL